MVRGEAGPVVLSLVERGWQAARECSLELQPQGMEFLHIIKGRLDRAVRSLIEPWPHIRIISLPRTLFWPVVSALVLGLWLTGKLRALLVDNPRSYRRLSRVSGLVRVPLTLVQWGDAGYELSVDSAPITRAAWWTQVQRRGQ
ncbi:MAG: hypothetical protein HYY59_07820 [Candidatus Omnitrophica bacterium]|nr:hypothetical protein [Candidatus Omnitrophota bacterium]MBI3021889.1 hypothetical protein [Candidatus Omnitrophota bacterium]